MDESRVLRELQKGSEDALAWIIERYTPYVSTVVGNIIGGSMSPADIEEVSADVFVALWNHAAKLKAGSLKSWLGSVARNSAKNKLRQLGKELPLEEDLVLVSDDSPEDAVERRERQRLVSKALNAMEPRERELFLRHYYYGQTLSAIASEMELNLSTVKTQLRRGREKLRAMLEPELKEEEGGAFHAV